MSYQAILGRQLNLDFVNLGFSGNGKGEPAVAKMVAEYAGVLNDAAASLRSLSAAVESNNLVEAEPKIVHHCKTSDDFLDAKPDLRSTTANPICRAAACCLRERAPEIFLGLVRVRV